MLTTLREVAPATSEYRHPLAKFSFKTVYADPAQRGAFTSKDLGTVQSRDILGEPGSAVGNSAEDGSLLGPTPEEEEKFRQEKTLEDLRFMPGDYLLVSITPPKTHTGPGTATPGFSIKGSSAAVANGGGGGAGPNAPGKWGGAGRGGDSGWASSPTQPLSAGGSWRWSLEGTSWYCATFER